MQLPTAYEKLSVIICSHYFTTGPAEPLETFLKPRIKFLVSILHPFYHSKRRHSTITSFSNGQIEKILRVRTLPRFGFLSYARDFAITFLVVIAYRKRFDLFIGLNSLLASCGLLLKKIGIVREVVLYTIDYVPFRFENKILNSVYHAVDRLCSERVDWTWNLSAAMIRERKLRNIKLRAQLVVPIGSNFERIKRLPINQVRRNRLVYMGSLREGQGIELAIEALPKIRAAIPDADMLVIGSGPLERRLRLLVLKLGLKDSVTFTGQVPNHEDVERMISSCGIAIAAYEPSVKGFTQYTEPGKVKVYLACGVPVIITKVPEIAAEIDKRGAGWVIDYDITELADGVMRLCTDDGFYRSARAAATTFASEYSWTEIFRRTFEGMQAHENQPISSDMETVTLTKPASSGI